MRDTDIVSGDIRSLKITYSPQKDAHRSQGIYAIVRGSQASEDLGVHGVLGPGPAHRVCTHPT